MYICEYICEYACVCVYMCAKEHVWMTKDILWDSVIFFYYESLIDWTCQIRGHDPLHAETSC